ncbi:hypothetical protein [Saccharothrix violaceirubra]|uniref:Uncharacterized protein n=1 Tax=Saccharothrix violaceirubra TaxID=413306 RepID=A0A7W7T2T9_9PSEU|nr:hypothetical protein [Saccharothrix violaceirubra]MBB4965534.1 hypothetical protein [Saccharothrix violaceirubra]
MDDVVLGSVTCPSGHLVLVDGGYLGLWSGERSPDETGEPAAVDFEVVGPDADAAARSFDRQTGRRLYDIPERTAGGFAAKFDEHCRAHGLDASSHRFPRRVPHRERVRHAVETGDTHFLISGVRVVPIGGVPTDRPLRVVATRGHWGWARIRIEVGDGTAVERRPLTRLGVDHARFAFADADALGSWVHEASLDGLADVMFWGRDEEEIAAEFGARRTGTPGDDVYAWLDIPIREAYRRAVALQELRSAEPERGFAFDFRPHSHHWQVMAAVRAADHEAATITIGGADIMMAMTSIGDGHFPVDLDLDATGAPVAVDITVDS